ncbi:MAG: tetratricopeptide repeat protein [Candidatus Eremiobacteraeota bacterium]|nr:tetratricopeptide repeat protein [Candidatus Eremiobacteraeota bacterium]
MKIHPLVLALALLGCQKAPVAPSTPSPTPFQYAYKYKDIAPENVDNAIKFHQKRLKDARQHPAFQIELAQAYLAKAQMSSDVSYFDEAEKLANSALKKQPENKAGLLIKASLCEATHDFQGAIKILQAMEKKDPGDLGTRALLANSLMEVGRTPEALEMSRDLFRQLPTVGSALQVSRAYIAAGDDEKARKILEVAIGQEQPMENKISARLRSLIGEIDVRHGRLEEAEQFFRASLEATPDNAQTFEDLARLKIRQGQPQEAEKLYMAAFAKTQHPLLLREVAQIKQAQGKTEEAKSMLQQAQTLLRPEVQKGRYGHARDLARVELDLGHPEEALKLLEQEEKQRQDWRLYELKAIALDALKRPAEALTALKTALGSGIQEPSLYQRAALWEPSGPWAEKLKKIDPSYTQSYLEK